MAIIFPSNDDTNEAAQEVATKKEWYAKLKQGPVTKNPHVENIAATKQKLISIINVHETIADFANAVNDKWYPHRNIINQYQSLIETINTNFIAAADAFIAHSNVQCGVKEPSLNPDSNDPAGMSISLAIADAVINFETEMEDKTTKDWQSAIIGCVGPNIALFNEIDDNLASLETRFNKLAGIVLQNTNTAYDIYATKSAEAFDNFPAWELVGSVPASEKKSFQEANKMLNKNLLINQLASGNPVIAGIMK
jgi:hypothetical protein